MIVRLTVTQRDNIASVATPLHEQWLYGHAERKSTNMLDISMPPIGWRTLADEIPQHAFGPMGGRCDGMATYGAGLRRISKQLAILESHPAFRTAGLPGMHFEMFLVWGDSPYPKLDAEPSMLIPHPSTTGGIVMTEWRRHYAGHGYGDLYEPEVHWAFTPPPTGPSAAPSP